jgi:uncharacterized repeat protein (TIGR02543 family)
MNVIGLKPLSKTLQSVWRSTLLILGCFVTMMLATPAEAALVYDNWVVTTYSGDGTDAETDTSNPQTTPAQYRRPTGIAFDAAGNLYVSDSLSKAIRKITPAGVVTTLTTLSGTNGVYALAVKPDGSKVYVGDTGDQCIRVIDTTNTNAVTTLAGDPTNCGGTPADTTPILPAALALDSTGAYLYVNNYVVGNILKIDTATGAVTAPYTGFGWSYGLAFDTSGNLYGTDGQNSLIKKIDTGGTVTTIAGDGGWTAADGGTALTSAFEGLQAIAIDPSGNMYIVDRYRVRKISTSGVVSTLAGQATAGDAEGTGATAQFSSPRGIAIDSSGNLYVADAANNRIRKLTAPPSPTSFTATVTVNSPTFSVAPDLVFDPSGSSGQLDNSGNCVLAPGTHRYETQTFIATGNVAHSVTTTALNGFGDDNFLAVYTGVFDPQNPTANLVGCNKDANLSGHPPTWSAFTTSAPLVIGQAYTAVFTGYPDTSFGDPSTTGTGTFSINPPVSLAYSVGGTLSGLDASKTVVLQNNLGNNLTLSANGSFNFSTALADLAAYSVTVLTQPAGQTCSVTSGNGNIAAANATGIAVVCAAPATYTVTYSGNGFTSGAVPTDATAYSSGATVTAVANSGSVARTGYTFGGWNTQNNGLGTNYTAGSGTFTINASTTLYAKWTINQHTVTFDFNTGAGTMANQSANYNVAMALTSNAFTKTGYTFAGWNTAAGGGGTSYVNAASYPFTASATLYAQWTLAPAPVAPVVEPPPPPANPIPTVIPPSPVAGVGGNQLNPLNLSSGDGPAMTTCLRDILRTVIGANAVYQGQTADGGARIGQTGSLVSFYALDATTSTNNGLGQGAGIYLRGSNPLNVVTNCGTFTTTPAVYNLTEWGAFLNGMGLSAQFNAQGVMTVVVGGTTYVARPDYSVTQGEPGAARLVTGTDGLMRFTDSAGNTQILYPAFIDPETLVNQIAQAVGGYAVIQTDGTALVTLWGGQKFVLTPDMTLGTVPPEQFAAGWWQDGPDHYRYRNSSFSATSQGFTVRAVP